MFDFVKVFAKRHLPTASPTLPLSALLTICPVELPTSLAGTETNFKIYSALILKSHNVAVSTPYSSVSFYRYLPSFSLLTMFTLSFTVKTTRFLLVAISPKTLNNFLTQNLYFVHTTVQTHTAHNLSAA